MIHYSKEITDETYTHAGRAFVEIMKLPERDRMNAVVIVVRAWMDLRRLEPEFWAETLDGWAGPGDRC